MTFLDSRRTLLAIALLSFGAVGAALISQYAFELLPCAWCVMQRLIFLLIGLLALFGAICPRQGALRRVAAAGIGLLAISGAVAAWYQHSVAALQFSYDLTFADLLMTESGLESGVPWLFGIQASCMDAVAYVLGVEYAIWSLTLFVILALASLWTLTRRD